MQFIDLFVNIGVIYLGIMLGYAVGRLSGRGSFIEKNLSYIVTYIFVPALFLNSITEKLASATEVIPLTVFSFSFPIVLLLVCYSAVYRKDITPKTKGAFMISGVFSNAIYLPTPIITAVIGVDGIIVVTIFATVQIIIRATLGTAISIYYSETVRSKLPKLMLNSILFPPLWATVAGFILYLFSFHFPAPSNEIIEFTGGLSIPLSVFITGLSLSTVKFQASNFDLIMRVTLIQLVIAPILGYLLLIPFSLSSIIIRSALVLVFMPPAMSNIIYANVFELDTKLTSSAVVFTTLILLIFLPVIIILLTFI